jgi:hypothetical protein
MRWVIHTPSDAAEPAGVCRPDTRRAAGLPGCSAAPSRAVQAPLVLELGERARQGAGCWAGHPPQPFFSQLPLALGTHDREKSLGDQSEGDVSIPAMPGAHLIVSQSHLTFAHLQTLLHRPATADGLHHLGQGGSHPGKDQEIGQLLLGCGAWQATAYHQPALPSGWGRAAQHDSSPRVEPGSFGSRARTQRLPG